MSGTPVGKRRFHAFLSHAHVDKDQADHLFKWLQDVAGMPVWYDAVNMPPGATIAQALPEAIENSRSVILLLSKQSVSRGWVQQEFNAAINHQPSSVLFVLFLSASMTWTLRGFFRTTVIFRSVPEVLIWNRQRAF